LPIDTNVNSKAPAALVNKDVKDHPHLVNNSRGKAITYTCDAAEMQCYANIVLIYTNTLM